MNWDEIVEEIGPKLYRYFSAGFETSYASDLVQETLTRLVRKVQQKEFEPKKGSLAAFAFGIARFVRLEALKIKALQSIEDVGGLRDNRPKQDDLLLFKEEQDKVRRQIAQLSDVQQEIVLLKIDQEMTLNQISELLCLPLNTVKSHLHRAKQALVEHFDESKEVSYE